MSVDGDVAVAVEHVWFGYRKAGSVLEDVDFRVPAGQSLAILGYNGVGKTTLLNLIVGLLRPSKGRAVINGKLIASVREVFELTERSNLIDSMSVRDNIRFRDLLFSGQGPARPTPGMEHLDRERLVVAFGLAEHLDKRVDELSSGLRKRAGLVAGLLFDPRLILLDEPTNSIDPLTRSLLLDCVGQLRGDGRTLVTVTHDLDYCWKVADRIIVLDDKRIALDRMTHDFADFDAFKKAATLGRQATHTDFGLTHDTATTIK
ncbi:ATP-binding cassette domain-containing protein [Bifidobacterium aquikefiricola]|uniref:ABC transporter ATP-binding protein n=1 Tax=Bifidobacterium aquikefiricola TaxID=3059038 RepID=A0AB39U898_9BIFI